MSGDHVPTVGVTGPDRGGWPAWICTRRALARLGVRACRITPNHVPNVPLHGLVLGGGADILEATGERADQGAEELGAGSVPTRRWADTIASLMLAPALALLRVFGSQLSGHRSDERRDVLEFELLARAERTSIPVLGICRGAQLMNLARGGSLLFDVQEFYSERPALRTVFPRRRVLVEPTSRLGAILGEREVAVNSLHHHAAGRVPDSLRIVARESTGVVQAIEDPFAPFFIGVQWHPEYLPQMPAQQRLFAALVDEARRAAASDVWISAPERLDALLRVAELRSSGEPLGAGDRRESVAVERPEARGP